MKNFRIILSAFTLFIFGNSAIAATNPTANFTVSPGTTITAGTTVCYTNTSTPNSGAAAQAINNWTWTFGGAAPDYIATTAGTANPPCVTYNTLGTFQTCLTVTDTQGDNNQLCRTISVVEGYDVGTQNGNTLSSICGALIIDNGGIGGNYTNNANNTVTICSGSTNLMTLQSSLIDLAAGDYIEIFNGPTTASPLITTITSANNGSLDNIVGNQTCITVRFVTNASGVAQGFSFIANCYNPNHVIMGGANNGISLSGCGKQIYDPGYTGNYSNNQSYTTTICANSSSQVAQILFNEMHLAAGDQLNFYDSSTGQLIYTAENSDNGNNSFLFPGLTVTGISQCMVVEFISNGSGTDTGFRGTISCPTPPAGCNGNPIAADNYEAATLICDFSAYCGTTSSFYGVDMGHVGQTSVFDGSLENNSWLSFIADAATASFNLNVTGCGSGLQVGIYSIDANENFTWLSPESINGVDYTDIDFGFTGSGVLNAQGMTPGETYYIMLDGHGGAVCNYSLTAGIGVLLPDAQASPDISMTCGDPNSVSVVDGNGSTGIDWTWTYTGTSSGGPFTGSSVDVSGLPAGTYNFTVEATDFTACTATPIEDFVTVTVTCPLPVELVNFNVECEQNGNVISWETISEQNNDYFDVQKSIDGSEFKSLEIIQGAGTTTHAHEYQVRDSEKINDVVYYRIRQVDIDGTENFSDIVSSNDCYTNGLQILKMYFNQSTSEVVIDYEVTRTTNAFLLMSDLVGRPYLSESLTLEPNSNQIRIKADNLSGNTMYILNVSSDNTSDTERIYVNH